MVVASHRQSDLPYKGLQMSAIERIQAVLDARVLVPQLMVVPTTGAMESEIDNEQLLLGRSFCADHVEILRRWNGIGLEVVRLFGCGDSAGQSGRISALQFISGYGVEGAIAVGADPSGFIYIQLADQRLFSLDSDGGEVTQVAKDLDDFFERLVFGTDASSFAGEEWLADLRSAGIIDKQS